MEYEPPLLLVSPALEIAKEYRTEPRNRQHAVVHNIGGSFDAIRLKDDLLSVPNTLNPEPAVWTDVGEFILYEIKRNYSTEIWQQKTPDSVLSGPECGKRCY